CAYHSNRNGASSFIIEMARSLPWGLLCGFRLMALGL
ncbi:MAG: hypothetical protein ACI83E_001938, partial [Sulfitobacter sp.]